MSTAAKRVYISLSHGERDALQQLAHEAGEPPATTAGRLLRAGLADHGAQLDTPPARRAGPPRARRPKHRPAPAADAPPDAIEALLTRYSADLRHLPPDLDSDRLVAEHVAALAAWRAVLDAATDPDPREQLAFGHELRTIATWLQDRARRTR